MVGRGSWWAACRLASTALIAGSMLLLLSGPHLPSAVLAQDACHYASTQRVAVVSDPAIREASALVASQQWPGIYWTLNDSGNGASVFAFSQDGALRGGFRVSGAGNVDWEALQIGPDGGNVKKTVRHPDPVRARPEPVCPKDHPAVFA